jgi:hypothetical protein
MAANEKADFFPPHMNTKIANWWASPGESASKTALILGVAPYFHRE